MYEGAGGYRTRCCHRFRLLFRRPKGMEVSVRVYRSEAIGMEAGSHVRQMVRVARRKKKRTGAPNINRQSSQMNARLKEKENVGPGSHNPSIPTLPLLTRPTSSTHTTTRVQTLPRRAQDVEGGLQSYSAHIMQLRVEHNMTDDIIVLKRFHLEVAKETV